MKPAVFEYQRAHSVEATVQLLADRENAKVIAGGQSLVPLMNFRLSRPAVVVDINQVAGLDGIRLEGDVLLVGALTRHQVLAEDARVKEMVPVLAKAARHIGHWAIRNRGTLGGSVVHADPAAELPAALVALEATVVAQSIRGERRIAAEDFFQGYYTTDLSPDELVVRVEIPQRTTVGFDEVVRRPGDFALVGAYVEATSTGSGAVTWFGLGARPVRQMVDRWADDAATRSGQLERLLEAMEMEPDQEYKRAMAVEVAMRAHPDQRREG